MDCQEQLLRAAAVPGQQKITEYTYERTANIIYENEKVRQLEDGLKKHNTVV